PDSVALQATLDQRLPRDDIAEAKALRQSMVPAVSDPTPLYDLPGLAAELGLGVLRIKDEGQRAGKGGVKALGAPIALARALARRATSDAAPNAKPLAVAATDGNHGLALAWSATLLGCRAKIFMGREADPRRAARIRAEGAEVVILPGTYDDAVRAAEDLAAADPAQVLLITDTDYGDSIPSARDTMIGYTLAGMELAAQWPEGPTHVLAQCGVGGVAASVIGGWLQAMGVAALPKVITVEPTRAAPMLASLRAGTSQAVGGGLETEMAGLACGEVSTPAFALMRQMAIAALSVEDTDIHPAMARLAAGQGGDPAVMAGDTGIAGLVGLRALCADQSLSASVGLGSESRVLLLCTEGPVPESA
ncbi:MAG: pyridoxal-phosphate dependent enzyme, partial [Rhodospirillaceae bacterium]